MKKENKGGAKASPKSNTERGDKRKVELQAAAELNGFRTWSAMFTHIKNEALKGRAVVVK